MSSPQPPLFTLRLALILLLALVCGGIVGLLAWLAGDNIPAAILAGLTAVGLSAIAFHNLIEDPSNDHGRGAPS
ncbi:hypothetical protein IOD16_16280 [Saccharothrix sp. 6-C]|uniref:hypothetical protein n=1 Tax=Saccharothrix sp. 6-C TaxID=2781735 RepID=UPI0019173CBC|nr:hypothetical protein [Saccharothrix sp. 6-C]QQQ79809.1 hypothetical protein IOD16_16280 [Saccharothrix sp. 6-C]